jgi:hypothetical protein
MSDEARELHRTISAAVRDMLDAYRIEVQAGPMSDKALEQLIFRGAQPVMHKSRPVPRRAAGRAPAEPGAHAAGDLPRARGERGRLGARGEGGLMRENALDWTWESGTGLSVQIGYVNSNGQRCCGHRGVPGTDHEQFAYKVECTKCGYVYGATVLTCTNVAAQNASAERLGFAIGTSQTPWTCAGRRGSERHPVTEPPTGVTGGCFFFALRELLQKVRGL